MVPMELGFFGLLALLTFFVSNLKDKGHCLLCANGQWTLMCDETVC